MTTKRLGPGEYPLELSDVQCPGSACNFMHDARTFDLAWTLARLPASLSGRLGATVSSIPAWGAFNAAVQRQNLAAKSKVGYLPVINAPSTQLSTCKKILDNAMNIATQVHQQDIVVVADQAIYAKLQEILWHDQSLQDQAIYSSVVPRMGAFHVICVLLTVIGKRFSDAGLRDILVESNVVSSGSVNAILEGRHYNRAVRAHLVLAEVMEQLRWSQYEEWLCETETVIKLEELQPLLNQVRQDWSEASVTSLMDLPLFNEVKTTYSEFCSRDHGPMFSFWNSYLNLVSLLRCFLRATRQGDWQMHLQCVRELLPWMFAYDRTNYCRYLSAYLCEMILLPKTHPEAYSQMEAGEFCVQRGSNAFAQVPVDQALEQTINRDTKVSGGIVGISLKPSAVQRWMLTAHVRAGFTQSCKALAGLVSDGEEAIHKGLQPSGISSSNDVAAQVRLLLQSFPNPFSGSESLFSLASGVVAAEDVKKDLLCAYDLGCQQMEDFFTQRLFSKAADFHATLSQLKLKTFSSQLKIKKSSGTAKQSVSKGHSNLFAQLAVAAQARDFNMKSVLQYELGLLPYALATVDGNLVKTAKSKLLPLLFSDGDAVAALPTSRTTTTVLDGMAILQCTVPNGNTFGSLAHQVLFFVTRDVPEGGRIDFVCDQYPLNSIKGLEREKRARPGSLVLKVSSTDQKLPSWKKFMSVSANKEQLIGFFVATWKASKEAAERLHQRQLYVTVGKSCESLTSHDGVTVESCLIPELHSGQEEADTRMFLHASHAADAGAEAVVIRSPDTDVAVIGLWAARHLQCSLYLDSGSGQHRRVVNLSDVAAKLGQTICDSLPGYHAFTGCDTVSSFARRGKSCGFKLLQKGRTEAMTRLGASLEPPSDALLQSCEEFVCAMYGKEAFISANDLRYHLFCSAAITSYAELPPTKDSLLQHVKRGNYQAYLWKQCLSSGDVPTPHNHGWLLGENDGLSIVWATQPPAPSALLELMHCGCKTGCINAKCRCVKSRLPCTDACQCRDCGNQAHHDTDDSSLSIPHHLSDDDEPDDDSSEAEVIA